MEVDHIEGVFTSDQLKGEGKVLYKYSNSRRKQIFAYHSKAN